MPRPIPTLLVLSVLAAWTAACSDPVAPTDFSGNFRALWEDFDVTYPFFGVKGADWEALRQEFEPRAMSAVTQTELRDVLGEMLLRLEDGHVRLETPLGTISYSGWYDRFPRNYDPQVVLDGHLSGLSTLAPQGTMAYGEVTPQVGYVHIPSWGGDGHAEDIDSVLVALSGVTGLIVDTRDNSGGNDLNGRAVAGRFADQRRLFRRIQFRNGPNHDDFTIPEDDFLDPAGPARFLGPIALLTNRRVFSSGEAFVLGMRVLPNVTVVGDTTGGGSANPAERTLPIGWTYTVSRWLVTTPEGTTFEGTGLAPDIAVQIEPADAAENRDTIVERAVQVLGGSG